MLFFLLACAADSAGDSAPEDDSAEPISFAATITPIFQSKCAACHYAEPEDLPLMGDEVYSLLVDHPSAQVPGLDRVEPSDLDNSYLWRKIDGTYKEVGGEGDPMPATDYAPLTEDEAVTIRSWILNGARP